MGDCNDDHVAAAAEARADRIDDEAEGYGAEEQSRRAAQQEAHRLEARAFFAAAPPYCIRPEENETYSLCRKHYAYWPSRPPAAATEWRAISNHPDFEQAERRFRYITSPSVFYDERGRLAKAPPNR